MIGMTNTVEFFVPDVQGVTVGNASLIGQAERGLGLTIDFVLGSASAIYGPVVFTAPPSLIPNAEIVGFARDASAGCGYPLFVDREEDGRLRVQAWTNVPYRHTVDLSSTVPFTWTTGDRIYIGAGA